MAFDNSLSEEQQISRHTCRRFMDWKVTRKYSGKCDMEGAHYYTSRPTRRSRRRDGFGLMMAEEHGGIGRASMEWGGFFDATAKHNTDFSAAALGVSVYAAYTIIRYRTPEQVARYLGPYPRAEVRFCISISKSQAGSDVASVRTRAVRDGDDYLLTGLKQWCSGSRAKNAVTAMLAETNPDSKWRDWLSVLLAPNQLPNMELGKLNTLARRDTGTNQIFPDGASGVGNLELP